MNWSKTQVTIHTEILKMNGQKEYHPYLTEELYHDQQLVGVALEILLHRAAESNPQTILVESDNGCDCKSSEHFKECQKSCNAIGISIL